MKLRMRLAGIEPSDVLAAAEPQPGALPFAEDLLAQDPLMQAHRSRMRRDATRRRN